MSAVHVPLTETEREEHRQMLFECEQSVLALNGYLAELLVLRHLLAACRRYDRPSCHRLPGRVTQALARVPARGVPADWVQVQEPDLPPLELIPDPESRTP